MKSLVLVALVLATSLYSRPSHAKLGCNTEPLSPICYVIAVPMIPFMAAFAAFEAMEELSIHDSLKTQAQVKKGYKIKDFELKYYTYRPLGSETKLILSARQMANLKSAQEFCQNLDARLARAEDLKALEKAAPLDLNLLKAIVFRLYDAEGNLKESGFMGWSDEEKGKDLFISDDFTGNSVSYTTAAKESARLASINHELNRNHQYFYLSTSLPVMCVKN